MTVLALLCFVAVATVLKLGLRRVFRGAAPRGDAPAPRAPGRRG
ncbi:MAG TPA: hypothetical protein VMU14_17915 [Acidimicrobiales bacterium]|nr:hypothetical protein [Acidimicrobiales bacterium]